LDRTLHEEDKLEDMICDVGAEAFAQAYVYVY